MRSLLLTARRAFRLDAKARTQAVRAVAWLALSRAALATVSYARVRRAVERLGPRTQTGPAMTPEECSRAIDRATRLLIGSRCLARGVAGECLLRREGRPATLTLGVHLDDSRRLQAHAWLQSDGIFVTGADEAARYASLEPNRVL